MDVTAIIVAASIPSALTGFFFWLIEQSIQKRADKEKAEREERQKEVDAREQIREKNELCIINCVNASLALGDPRRTLQWGYARSTRLRSEGQT